MDTYPYSGSMLMDSFFSSSPTATARTVSSKWEMTSSVLARRICLLAQKEMTSMGENGFIGQYFVDDETMKMNKALKFFQGLCLGFL
jgi:hypothetical protein